MAEYKNDLERKMTEEYEGIYTPKEIELNKKLYLECSKEIVNFEKVEKLLQEGADPLGPTVEYGWDILDHVYGEIVMESQDFDSVNLPRITELFLKYGMDIDNPKIPYDGGNSINPMWHFGFAKNENSIYALKIILDKGISVESFRELWETSIGDLLYCDCGDPVNDAFWTYVCIWSLKTTMLAASYDYILENDEYLKRFIGVSYNDYDIHNFRNWNNYAYKFDTSHCNRYPGYPEFYQSIVTIYNIEANKEVWKIGIGLPEGSF